MSETHAGSEERTDDHHDDVRKIITATQRPVGIDDVMRMQKNYEDLMQRYGRVLHAPHHRRTLTTANTFS